MFKKEFYTKAYNRFLKIHGEPKEIAAGAGLGVFIAFSPLVGVHMLLTILSAAILKLNKISATIALLIACNPLTAPLIYGVNYFIGKKIMLFFNTPSPPIDVSALSFKELLKLIYKVPEVFSALVIGGIITGIPAAIITYWLAYAEIITYREKIKDKHIPEKIAEKLHLTKHSQSD